MSPLFGNILSNNYVYKFNLVSFIWTIFQEQPSSQCCNIGTKLTINCGGDFTTYGIFQSREVLVNWAREVGKFQGLFIIIKRSLLQEIKRMKGTCQSCFPKYVKTESRRELATYIRKENIHVYTLSLK